jgi:VTC domain
LTSRPDGNRGACGARLALVLGTGALFLLPCAAPARADPTFVLSQSTAGPGEPVHFSIAGTETRASYILEVAGHEVGQGSVPAETGYAGDFTMPDLGDASRAVVVEAEIAESDETFTRARSLQYVLTSAGTTGPSAPEPAPVLAPASATQAATANVPAPRAVQRGDVSQPARRKRRTARTPHRARERQGGLRRAARAPARRSRQGPAASHGPVRRPAHGVASLKVRKPSPSGRPDSHRPAGRGKRPGPSVATILTAPLNPAVLSFASGLAVNGGGGGGDPAAALMVLSMLGLTALALASGGLVLERRPARLRAGRRRGTRLRARPRPRRRDREPCDRAERNGRSIAPEQTAVPLAQVAASFAPVPLAVVDQQATLATRSEQKYILDATTFDRLIGEIAPHYLILEIDGERVFPYDSVYFDTPDCIAYRQHVQGRRRRFKCRTRLYATSALCFFEVKLKGGRGETIKRRLPVALEEHGSLTTPALAFLERQLDVAYGAPLPAPLAPSVRTFYRRLTLMGQTNEERLTFDFELTLAARGREFSILPGRILLEDKRALGAVTGAVQANRVLQRLGVRPVRSCSKYCLGVALSHPQLSDNPFRSLIHRHFVPRVYPTPVWNGNGAAPAPAVELEAEWEPAASPRPAWQEGSA